MEQNIQNKIENNNQKNSDSKMIYLKIAIIVLTIIIVITTTIIIVTSQKDTPKDKIETNKTENVTKEPNKTPESNNQDSEIEPLPENKPAEGYTFEYQEETYTTKTNKGITLTTNKRKYPNISNNNQSDIAKKIENSIMTFANSEWENIKNTADDLTTSINNEEEIYNPDIHVGLGVDYTISHEELSNNVLVFHSIQDGSFGGVSWYEAKGYNYNETTGELLTLKTITNDYDKLYKIIKVEIDKKINELKKEEAYFLYETEKELETLTNKAGNWMFTKDGIKIVYQKYEIADGATGTIEISIDKELINPLLKSEYQL